MPFVAGQTPIEDLEALTWLATDKRVSQWLYIGEDSAWRIRAERALGPRIPRCSIAEKLGDMSWKLRQPYIDWIGELSQTNDSLEWWSSSLAEKNPFDELYVRICLLACGMELIRGGLEGGTLVVCSSSALLNEVVRFAAGMDIPLEKLAVPGRHPRLRSAGGWGRGFLRFPYRAVRREVARVWGAAPPALETDPATRRTVLARRGLRRQGDFSGDKAILLFTWVDRRSFASDGSYQDPYLGRLPDELKDRGYTVAYAPRILPSIRFEDAVDRLLQTGERFFFRELFVTPREIRAFGKRASQYRPVIRPDSQIDGIPVHDLAMEHLEGGRRRPIEALICERLIANLAAAGIKPRRVIHPWHGQSWEHALAWSVSRNMPGTSVVGYDVGTFSRMYLSTFPARSELGIKPLPDRVVTNGDMAWETLTHDGLPSEIVGSGCSLRFPEMASRPVRRDYHDVKQGDSPVRIVVAPSIGFGDSVDLSAKAISAFGGVPGFEVVVKWHPLVPTDEMAGSLGHLGRHDNVSFSKEPAGDILASAHILLYTCTSVCFDALRQGVMPVFVLSENDLHMDKLDAAPEVRRVATSSDDLRRVVKEIMDMTPTQWRRWQESAQETLSKAFAPVTPERVDEFLV